jgi:hypothetical protein
VPHLLATQLTPPTSAPRAGSPLPHLRQDWAHPCQHLHCDWLHPAHSCIAAGTLLSTAHIYIGTHPCHICAGTRLSTTHICAWTISFPQQHCPRIGLIPTTLLPGRIARPCPHLRRDSALNRAHLQQDSALHCPHVHRDSARPCPRVLRDSAHRCHICAGTALIAATSAPALGAPLPHLYQDSAHLCTSAPGLLWTGTLVRSTQALSTECAAGSGRFQCSTC